MTTPTETRTLALGELLMDPTIQIRERTDEETVQRYMDCFDDLPPVHVVQTGDGQLLLADGWHRVHAARQLDCSTITATVQTGTRDDALRIAAWANAKHGKSLSSRERDEGCRRLRAIDPHRSLRSIASQMGTTHETVRRALRVTNVTAEEIPIHEYLNIIPPMNEETYRGLKGSIKEWGLQTPIVLHEGQIIDGRYRYRACRELGITPQFTEYEGDNRDVLDRIYSLNVTRRFLTEAQIVTILVEVEEFLAAAGLGVDVFDRIIRRECGDSES